MTHVASAPHELEADWNFFEHGLSPYWAVTNLLVNQFDGHADQLEYDLDGEQWSFELYYQKGGIAPRPDDPIDAPRLYEPRLKARGHGERKVTFHVRPRFKGMEHYESGDRISTPCDRDSIPNEGVNVHVQGSNLEPEEYERLLPQLVQLLFAEAGQRFNHEYFNPRYIHDSSNAHSYERYLRIRRSMNQKIIGTSGILQKLHHLLLDEEGVRYSLEVDNEDTVGKMHRLPLRQSAARELPVGNRGKQVKSYLLKNPDSVDETDPTHHPKLGVLFNKELNNSTVRWSKIDDLQRELNETLINLLYWSNVPTDPDQTTFVPDSHFDVSAYDENPTLRLYDDPTPKLEASQEALLVQQMRELTDADMDHLEAMTDSGQCHYEEVIDEADTSVSTLYRTLKRCDALLESDNGVVKWRSKKIRQEFAAVFERVEETVEAAADQAARILDLDPRQLKEKGSAFQRWLTQYGAEVINDGSAPRDRVHIKITSVLNRYRQSSGEYIGKVLEYLEVVWTKAGFDAPLHKAIIEFNTGNGYHRLIYGSDEHERIMDSSTN
ncbi:DUF7845 domain-containing protein [Halorussus pelagicus]|uniref:DUF7845 domain-containing protein n=1 Tax=Halorussus pelagicus TaxID=2505977 RepID=UPI000FFBBDBF|nr:hypothetical protein [Halorussus pelagicus]